MKIKRILIALIFIEVFYSCNITQEVFKVEKYEVTLERNLKLLKQKFGNVPITQERNLNYRFNVIDSLGRKFKVKVLNKKILIGPCTNCDTK